MHKSNLRAVTADALKQTGVTFTMNVWEFLTE
jgi:hypothetical protein